MDKIEYPDETEGTKIARENRAICNNLTEEERGIYLNKALDIIYKDCPEKDPRKSGKNKND